MGNCIVATISYTWHTVNQCPGNTSQDLLEILKWMTGQYQGNIYSSFRFARESWRDVFEY